MRPSVSYLLFDASSKKQTGNIITFTHFEGEGLLSEIREDLERNDKTSDKSDDDSIMPQLLSLEKSNALDSGYESDDELMSTELLDDICYRSQSHPDVNRRDAHYKIRDRIKIYIIGMERSVKSYAKHG